MIYDIHSHILPKMDDGSKSTEESLQMLELSKSQGVDLIVATPHFYITRNSLDEFLKKREASYNRLMEVIEGKDVPQIKLGAEVKFFNAMSGFDDLNKLCIENTNYMLLEMPFEVWSSRMLREIEKILHQGIVPIIAHIERYIDIQKKTSNISELISMDVYVQMNGEFVNSLMTRKKALNLLSNDIVQLLGSDCHNMTSRKPDLDKTCQILRKKFGGDIINKINKTAENIISNK